MFKDILCSFYQLADHVLFGKYPQVVLYYPQHFNRSVKGTNPYFEPIIDLCKENGINFLVMEEPDGGTTNPRDPQCMKADVLFWAVTILRKLMRVIYNGGTQSSTDARVSWILDAMTFHKLRARRYVTISNSMIDILVGLSPKGVVYDYQHGIIYKGHPGYFIEKYKLATSYTAPNRRVMLWGTLYKKAFEEVLTKDYLNKQVKVVGYPIKTPAIDVGSKEKQYIIISLQITSDGEAWYKHSPKMLYECLEQLKINKNKVLLKHHPRFNNAVDFNDITTKYPFVEFTSKSLYELVSQALFHITWSSTTCFEYATYGIPTYFLIDSVLAYGKTIFYEQYCYPLYDGMSISEVMNRIADKERYNEDCQIVKQWYNSAYAPFDKQQMLKILTENED